MVGRLCRLAVDVKPVMLGLTYVDVNVLGEEERPDTVTTHVYPKPTPLAATHVIWVCGSVMLQLVALYVSPVLPPEYLADSTAAPAPKSPPFSLTNVPPVVASDTIGAPKEIREGALYDVENVDVALVSPETVTCHT